MPGIQMIPHMMGHRPLFPSAVATSAMSQQKPTFPAYSNATISAPPTVGASSTSTNNVSDAQKPPTIPQSAGTASKIIHPPEDVSLEELRARKPQYQHRVTASPQSSASSTPTSAASNKYNESKMVQAAQEVSFVPISSHFARLMCACVDVFVIYLTFLSQFCTIWWQWSDWDGWADEDFSSSARQTLV